MRKRFTATIEGTKAKAFVSVPFDPDAVWRPKDAHYVSGTANGNEFRGLIADGRIKLGPAWLRDNADIGDEVTFDLGPEGHLTDNVAPDLADLLNADEATRRYFDSLPGFYRNNFMRDIDSAKTPETRAKRIARAMDALRDRRRST